ncbi:MAG: hypothetical protein Q4B26_06860, partial [Eubacteriales bacterium]|nr:hypothetical protein [Eubacteriales bacterium]
MKRKVFAVCDIEKEYALRLMNYLSQRHNIPFEIQVFTTVESLGEYTKNHEIELLLISDQAMVREVREMKIKKIILLSEGEMLPEGMQYPMVYKYQSTGSMLREVMSYYGEDTSGQTQGTVSWKNKTRFIGVYSPIHRCLKTSIALAMGQLSAVRAPTLFLTMDEYAGLEEWRGEPFGANLTDLLYYAKQKDSGLIHRMNGMIFSVNQLDMIPPVKTPWDLRSVQWEDWEVLFREISEGSNYETVILDMGSEVDDLYSLLKLCDLIYMPVLGDAMSEAKIRQYEKLLTELHADEVIEK